jgi:hypothetical protein
MITIAVATDLSSLAFCSTLISSILRRTDQRLHVRLFSQGFSLPLINSSFSVEPVETPSGKDGRSQAHLATGDFGGQGAIRNGFGCDRCLEIYPEQLVLCDLAPYFNEDSEGNFLLGRLLEPTETVELHMATRGGLPQHLRYAADYSLFFMGPMMNLALMRKHRIWQKISKVRAPLQQNSQIALTVATGGKVKGVGRKWNLDPQFDNFDERPPEQNRPVRGNVGQSAELVNGLPQGIIHWTGLQKPWDRWKKVWRADLWESEETSWEALRRGWWQKPTSVELWPDDETEVMALGRRGWKVVAIGEGLPGLKKRAIPFPDVYWHSEAAGLDVWARLTIDMVTMVRAGIARRISPLLKKGRAMPPCVVLQGPVPKTEVAALLTIAKVLRVFTRFRRRIWCLVV